MDSSRDVNSQEELVERSRQPTKICLEYHLHQRGSKSQTFALPPAAPPSRRPPPSSRKEEENQAPSVVALEVNVGKGKHVEHPPSVAAPEIDVEKEAGLLLPPADSLVELVLSPFKGYDQSRTLGGDGGGRTHEAGGETNNRRGKASPPVVKLNVSLLGFVNLGVAASVSPPPGQRTLCSMAWLGRDAPSAALSMDAPSTTLSMDGHDGSSSGGGRSSGNENPDEVAATRVVPDKHFPNEKAAARVQVAPGKKNPGEELAARGGVTPAADFPVEQPAPVPPTSAIDYPRPDGASLLNGNPRKRGRDDDPLQVAERSVLVRCPRCKACLPLGDMWDAHREEHLLILERNKSGRRLGGSISAEKLLPGTKPPVLSGVLPSPHPSVVSPSRGAMGLHAPGGNPRSGGVAGTRHTRSSLTADEGRVDDTGYVGGGRHTRLTLDVDGGRSDGDGRGGRMRLSDLLLRAVSPAQASDVLKERGLLRCDGQTRFAHLGLAEGQRQSALDEQLGSVSVTLDRDPRQREHNDM